MASHSPTGIGKEQASAYERGWQTISWLMDRGNSWSGNERNNAFLNTRDGRLADVSAVTGLDFDDDGRGVASVDWDGDGDLDLWLRNRTGPQLRFMKNTLDAGRSVSIRLQGRTCNRDAIGARVQVTVGGVTHLRHVQGGDGYLSHSSRRIHVGLGAADGATRIVVRWPGGEPQQFDELAAGRYVWTQGEAPRRLQDREVPVAAGALSVGPPPTSSAFMLRQRMPVPPTLHNELFQGRRPTGATLVNLWAKGCDGCDVELAEWALREDDFRQAGITVVCLNVDEPGDRAAAEKKFAGLTANMKNPFREMHCRPNVKKALRVLLAHVTGGDADEVPMPTSLLVDEHGALEVVYLGPASVDDVIAHRDLAKRILRTPVRRTLRHGRWYLGIPRDYGGLARRMQREGLRFDAQLYQRFANRQRK